MSDDIQPRFREGSSVEIFGLASAKGKPLNHRLATVGGAIKDGRCPVRIRHITGEVEVVSLKPANIGPVLDPGRETKERSRLDFINYSSDAKVREGHGRLLDNVLCLMRWAVNVMCGRRYFAGTFEDFCKLPRSDEAVMMTNIEVFSMYRVKPSSAGYRVPGDMSVLDGTIHSLAENEGPTADCFGTMAQCERDGPGGKLIVRNMVRFMQAWDTERIHGEFFICKIVRTGTLAIQQKSDGRLGNVYLVKGVGNAVGSQVPKSQLPLLVQTTFLPLYDMLVYDQLMMVNSRAPVSQSLKDQIDSHVTNAVREGTVVYSGESAARGMWDDEPPEIVKPVPSDGERPDTFAMPDNGLSSGITPCQATPEQIKAAKSIVQFAKQRGYKEGKGPGGSALIARRFGYTREDNPMQMVGLMYNDERSPYHCSIEPFNFKQWPTYTLDELLPPLLKRLKQVNDVPTMIAVDEKSVVEPLSQALKAANDEIGFEQNIRVEWYPPPSAEEQAFHQRGF